MIVIAALVVLAVFLGWNLNRLRQELRLERTAPTLADCGPRVVQPDGWRWAPNSFGQIAYEAARIRADLEVG